MAKKYDHIHKYHRVRLGKNYVVMRCTMPTCSHYIKANLTMGKMNMCNRCGVPFMMNARSIQLAYPHCDNCVDRRSIA